MQCGSDKELASINGSRAKGSVLILTRRNLCINVCYYESVWLSTPYFFAFSVRT